MCCADVAGVGCSRPGHPGASGACGALKALNAQFNQDGITSAVKPPGGERAPLHARTERRCPLPTGPPPARTRTAARP